MTDETVDLVATRLLNDTEHLLQVRHISFFDYEDISVRERVQQIKRYWPLLAELDSLTRADEAARTSTDTDTDKTIGARHD